MLVDLSALAADLAFAFAEQHRFPITTGAATSVGDHCTRTAPNRDVAAVRTALQQHFYANPDPEQGARLSQVRVEVLPCDPFEASHCTYQYRTLLPPPLLFQPPARHGAGRCPRWPVTNRLRLTDLGACEPGYGAPSMQRGGTHCRSKHALER